MDILLPNPTNAVGGSFISSLQSAGRNAVSNPTNAVGGIRKSTSNLQFSTFSFEDCLRQNFRWRVRRIITREAK